MSENKALIIAGTHSGCGKTTVSLGIMAALSRAGYRVQPFKCGPDFIDPSLHKLVTGKVSRNLDLWMCGQPFCRDSLDKQSRHADLAVIEGVMGMFDGGESSSASLSAAFGIPTILVLDVSSAAESAAAVLKGFEQLNPSVAPEGVILNKVAGERHLDMVSTAIEQHCSAEIVGYVPSTLQFTIPSRHLGLHMGDEQPLKDDDIERLAESIQKHVDLEKLVVLGEVPKKGEIQETRDNAEQFARIGIARDNAFCFYYQDNLDLLRAAGAELIYFSPLNDTTLPESIDGLYLGGGYPELWANRLSSNRSMISSIKDWVEDDGPVYSECGGFMYLTKGIVDHDGRFHEMVDVFPVRSRMQKNLAALGYREIHLQADSFFGPTGTTIRGHEFHYSSIDRMPDSIERNYEGSNSSCEGYRYKNCVGGYSHLHFGLNPNVAAEFVKFCHQRKNKSNS